MTKARTNADNQAGDISGVTASTGLTGGGTSGTVTVSLDTTSVYVIPSQTSNSGKYLTTDGTNTSWATVSSGNITTSGMYEMANTISSNYTIGTGNNAVSAGPITINTGVTVTVPTGSTWVIV